MAAGLPRCRAGPPGRARGARNRSGCSPSGPPGRLVSRPANHGRRQLVTRTPRAGSRCSAGRPGGTGLPAVVGRRALRRRVRRLRPSNVSKGCRPDPPAFALDRARSRHAAGRPRLRRACATVSQDSSRGAAAGAGMALRATMVVVAFTAVSSELRNPAILAWLERRRLRGLSDGAGDRVRHAAGVHGDTGGSPASLVAAVATRRGPARGGQRPRVGADRRRDRANDSGAHRSNGIGQDHPRDRRRRTTSGARGPRGGHPRTRVVERRPANRLRHRQPLDRRTYRAGPRAGGHPRAAHQVESVRLPRRRARARPPCPRPGRAGGRSGGR